MTDDRRIFIYQSIPSFSNISRCSPDLSDLNSQPFWSIALNLSALILPLALLYSTTPSLYDTLLCTSLHPSYPLALHLSSILLISRKKFFAKAFRLLQISSYSRTKVAPTTLFSSPIASVSLQLTIFQIKKTSFWRFWISLVQLGYYFWLT
jgi:hypothetical protein